MTMASNTPARRVASFQFESQEPKETRTSPTSSDRSRSTKARSSKNSKNRSSKNSRTPKEKLPTQPPPSHNKFAFAPLEESACIPGKDACQPNTVTPTSDTVDSNCKNQISPLSIANPISPVARTPLQVEPASTASIATTDFDSPAEADADRASLEDGWHLVEDRNRKSISAASFAAGSGALTLDKANFRLSSRILNPNPTRVPAVTVATRTVGLAPAREMPLRRVEGPLEIVRKGFLAKFLCAPRYCVFEPESRRLFLWKNKKSMDSGGTSKCLDRVVSGRLLKLEDLNFEVRHADGNGKTTLRAPNVEERNRWLAQLQTFAQVQLERKEASAQKSRQSVNPSTTFHNESFTCTPYHSIHTQALEYTPELEPDQNPNPQNIRQLFMSEHQRSLQALRSSRSRVSSGPVLHADEILKYQKTPPGFPLRPSA